MDTARFLGLALALWLDAAAAAADAPAWRVAVPGSAREVRQDRSGLRKAAAIAAATPPAAAELARPSAWRPLGPCGGEVADVAFSPVDADLALAALASPLTSRGGLHRSLDAGRTWRPVADLGTTPVHDIEFARDGTAVYVGTDTGVWSSIDRGATWARHALGIGPNAVVLDVALDPSKARTVWAGVADALGAQPRNVLLSLDGGATWVDRTPPLDAPLSTRGIAVNPADPANVVVAFGGDFGGGQVWVTPDGGLTWSNRSAGLPANPMRSVLHLGQRILLGGGQRFGGQGVGLYESRDGGQHWAPLHDASWPSLAVEDVAVAPGGDPLTIWVATDGAGVNRSYDGGASWEVAVAGAAAHSIAARAGGVLIGTAQGILRSEDDGASFAASNVGIDALYVAAVDASPLDPRVLAAAFQGLNSGGVYSSTDGGATWSLEPVPPTRYSDVRFGGDGALYALSSGPSNIAPEGLYARRIDGTWRYLGPDQGPLFESNLVRILTSDTDPAVLVLAGADFGVAGFEGAIWRSADGGGSWRRVYESTSALTVEDIEDGGAGFGHAVTATWSSRTASPFRGGVLRSSDGGVSWKQADAGMPGEPFADGALCRPATPLSLIQSVRSNGMARVFRSVDGGATWSATGWSSPEPDVLATDVACDGDTVYRAGTQVMRSLDRGASFEPWTEGLPQGTAPLRLTAVASGGYRLLAATTSGVYGLADDELFEDGLE